MSTIFALSSGSPPAGIAVIRITGPLAGSALSALIGELPRPRFAARRWFRAPADGSLLDDGLALWFPGPNTVTGEDVAECHVHGGRAVVAALEAALATIPGLQRARAGEFTRRAFANGRIDLPEAEGLADLLEAETELQRRAALTKASGRFSRKLEGWRERVLTLSAAVEAALDFSDESESGELPPVFDADLNDLHDEMVDALAAPSARPLREGFRVALAGPPNAGKSTLFNALVESEAAITSPHAGTTRDVIARSVAIDGVPLLFVDMAGLRDTGAEAVEAMGIARARGEIELADLVLWLGPENEGPPDAWEIEAQIDREERPIKAAPRHRISAVTGAGIEELIAELVRRARCAMPKPGEAVLNERQRQAIAECARALDEAVGLSDILLMAEALRRCRTSLDSLLGRSGTEQMLDALFGRFCIGK